MMISTVIIISAFLHSTKSLPMASVPNRFYIPDTRTIMILGGGPFLALFAPSSPFMHPSFHVAVDPLGNYRGPQFGSASPIKPNQRDELMHKMANYKSEMNELFEKPKNLSGHRVVGKVQTRQVGGRNICLSKECVAASHKLFQNMDVRINPCDDFYEFSCGNFIKEATIPDDKGRVSSSISPLVDRSKCLSSSE